MEFEVTKTEKKNITVKNKKGAREQKTVFRYKLESFTGDKATMICEDDTYAYGDTLEIRKLRSQAKLTTPLVSAEKPLSKPTFNEAKPKNAKKKR